MGRLIWVAVIGIFEIIQLTKCEQYPEFFSEKQLEETFGMGGFNSEHPYRPHKKPQKTRIMEYSAKNGGGKTDIPHIPGQANWKVPRISPWSSYKPKPGGRQGQTTVPLDLDESPVLRMLVLRTTSTKLSGTDMTATFAVSLLPTIWYLNRHFTTRQQVIYRPKHIQLMTSGINLVAKSKTDQNFTLLPSLPTQDGLTSINVPADKTLRADKKVKEIHYNNGQKVQEVNKAMMRSQQQRDTYLEQITKPNNVLTGMDDENPASDELSNSEATMIKTREQIPLQRFHLLHTSNIPHLLWDEMNDPKKQSELHHKISAANEGDDTKKYVDDYIKNIHYQSKLLKAPKGLHQKDNPPIKNAMNSLTKQKNANYNGQIESEDDINFSDLLSDERKSIRSAVTITPDTGPDYTTLSAKEFVVTY